MNLLIVGFLGAVAVVLAYLLMQRSREARNLRERYAGIADIQAQLQAARRDLEHVLETKNQIGSENEQRRAKLSKEYQEALGRYEQLKKEIALLEENLEDISFGIYKPHFSFQSSEEYKTALEQLRDRERQLVRNGRAAVCPVQWTVGDSAKQGQRMVKQYMKVMLCAFNSECEAAVANVSWNNITRMEERVRKFFDAVNELGGVMQVSLTPEFLQLKLDELRLTHEYEEKKYQEREEQRKVREQIREEEKAQRELEKAREQAEREEADYEKALAQAREEAFKATGAQLQKLSEHIQSLEAKVDEARRNKERAISRAQLTKSGFVYVISNVGSFGERVFKIGMTRRLEPMERIAELGDASVPFPFDLHAMLYSDDAPALEAALHQLLEDRRVNLVNPRKEFYHSVELEEIEVFVKQRGLSAQFIKVAEAKEYRETVAMREQQAPAKAKHEEPAKFTPELFSAAGASS